jgi:hypothetical protein
VDWRSRFFLLPVTIRGEGAGRRMRDGGGVGDFLIDLGAAPHPASPGMPGSASDRGESQASPVLRTPYSDGERERPSFSVATPRFRSGFCPSLFPSLAPHDEGRKSGSGACSRTSDLKGYVAQATCPAGVLPHQRSAFAPKAWSRPGSGGSSPSNATAALPTRRRRLHSIPGAHRVPRTSDGGIIREVFGVWIKKRTTPA